MKDKTKLKILYTIKHVLLDIEKLIRELLIKIKPYIWDLQEKMEKRGKLMEFKELIKYTDPQKVKAHIINRLGAGYTDFAELVKSSCEKGGVGQAFDEVPTTNTILIDIDKHTLEPKLKCTIVNITENASMAEILSMNVVNRTTNYGNAKYHLNDAQLVAEIFMMIWDKDA